MSFHVGDKFNYGGRIIKIIKLTAKGEFLVHRLGTKVIYILSHHLLASLVFFNNYQYIKPKLLIFRRAHEV